MGFGEICSILWIDIVWGLQKLGLILESKVVQKLSLEKNVFNKKCCPKFICLGGVHKLRLQDEVGRWLSKCQQMLTEVGR